MAQAPDGRTPAQVADEKAMAHISAVLTNLDWTIERARKGIKELRKTTRRGPQTPPPPNLSPPTRRAKGFSSKFSPPPPPPPLRTPPGGKKNPPPSLFFWGRKEILGGKLWADLTALHRELDVAVAACYGWPRAVAQDDDELVRRLTALNREISQGARAYAPFDHLGDDHSG